MTFSISIPIPVNAKFKIQYTVTFDTVPADTGSITFDGASYSDGDSVLKGAGTYDITANPGSGYTFTEWETVGGVSVADPSSATTTCTVSGEGTLRMVQTEMEQPVGGVVLPVDKLRLIAPWIGLFTLVGALFSAMVIKRRKPKHDFSFFSKETYMALRALDEA
ncbi:MAG: hypothetical protein ACE5OO_00950 [Candidatus Bathyarchaeia archaeon]